MALTAENWSLTSYTNDTWTDLVDEAAQIATLNVSNVGAGSINVQIRIDDGAGSEVVRVLPPAAVDVNEAFTLDVRSLNVTGSQRLQVRADAAGGHFFASGVVAS